MINIPLAERASALVYRGWMRRDSSWLNMPICSARGAHNFSASKQSAISGFTTHTHVGLHGACDTSISPNCFSPPPPPPVDVTVAPLPVSLWGWCAFLINAPNWVAPVRVVYSSTNYAPLHLISYFIRTFWGSNASRARGESLSALVKWSDPMRERQWPSFTSICMRRPRI